jgi:hypothetical protein
MSPSDSIVLFAAIVIENYHTLDTLSMAQPACGRLTFPRSDVIC